MECIGQIEANRRNARNSTGPTTEEGKQRSRCSRDTRVQSREHSGILCGPLLQQPGHAQMMRGRYLMNDAAGDLNPVESRMWLERAVAQGVTDAEHDLAAEPASRTPAASEGGHGTPAALIGFVVLRFRVRSRGTDAEFEVGARAAVD